MRRSRTGATAADAKALYTFLKDVRAGKSVSNKDIIQFAGLFSDELTLDNLDRVHLVTLCQVRDTTRQRLCGFLGPSYAQRRSCLRHAACTPSSPLCCSSVRTAGRVFATCDCNCGCCGSSELYTGPNTRRRLSGHVAASHSQHDDAMCRTQ